MFLWASWVTYWEWSSFRLFTSINQDFWHKHGEVSIQNKFLTPPEPRKLSWHTLNMKKVVGSAHHPRFWPKYNISPTSLPCHVNDSITAGNCRPMITSKSETNNWDIEVSPANISPTWISPEIRGCPFLSYLLGWGRVRSLQSGPEIPICPEQPGALGWVS